MAHPVSRRPPSCGARYGRGTIPTCQAVSAVRRPHRMIHTALPARMDETEDENDAGADQRPAQHRHIGARHRDFSFCLIIPSTVRACRPAVQKIRTLAPLHGVIRGRPWRRPCPHHPARKPTADGHLSSLDQQEQSSMLLNYPDALTKPSAIWPFFRH
jgi:hypothetical protein